MRYDLYLSYSGRKTYMTCPNKYRFQYIIKEPCERDPRQSFLGSALGKVFELFYNNKLWLKPDPIKECLSLIDKSIDIIFKKENWNENLDVSVRSNLRTEMTKLIPIGIEIIRSNGLLTLYSTAESDLSVIYTDHESDITLKMGGRSDFIHGNDRSNIYIIDGKASKHRELYVDSDQLIWYAVLHYIKYNVVPIKLGFLFWLFPDNPLLWIDYNAEDMKKLVKETFKIAKLIKEEEFGSKSSSECYKCPYSSKCEDGSKYIRDHKIESRIRVEDSIFLLESVNS